jgi:hypothetical protein
VPDGYQQHPRPPESVTVALDIDADIMDWLQEQPGWRREIRDLLRFYMESHLIREAAFETAAPDSASGFPETFFLEG